MGKNRILKIRVNGELKNIFYFHLLNFKRVFTNDLGLDLLMILSLKRQKFWAKSYWNDCKRIASIAVDDQRTFSLNQHVNFT